MAYFDKNYPLRVGAQVKKTVTIRSKYRICKGVGI